MENLVKNEHLPATSDPPIVAASPTSVNMQPPPYEPVLPQQTVLVRSTYNEAPPGVTAKAIVSIVLSVIAFFCSYVTAFCAIPSIVFGVMALSSDYSDNQRKSYANTALGLMLGGVVTAVIIVVLVVVLLINAGSESSSYHGYY